MPPVEFRRAWYNIYPVQDRGGRTERKLAE